jgi:hypothetical protein
MKEQDNNVISNQNLNLRQSITISRADRRQLPSLAAFFEEGLKRGELCVAVLKRRHLRKLNKLLSAKGIDVESVSGAEQYFALDVNTVLSLQGDEENEDDQEASYQRQIEKIAELAAREGQRVRAFGEIAGLHLPRLGLFVPQHE